MDLEFPTQGGFVLYVAARVHDMSGCRAKLSATLRDPTGVNSVTLEARPVDFVVADGDGGIPKMDDVANTANVPVCPNFGARDYVDQEYQLEVTVTDPSDAGARSATKAITVRPACRQTGQFLLAACRCQCAANYYLGKTCSCDGGSCDGG